MRGPTQPDLHRLDEVCVVRALVNRTRGERPTDKDNIVKEVDFVFHDCSDVLRCRTA
jgi:hypothetical protein